MEFFLSWVLFFCLLPGILSAMILEGKGSGGCLGFILGFLLSYLGVIIALLIPNNERKIKYRNENIELSQGTMKKCKYCAEAIKKEAIKCKYCGENV